MKAWYKNKWMLGVMSIGIVASLGWSLYTSFSIREEGAPAKVKEETTKKMTPKTKEKSPHSSDSSSHVVMNPMDGKNSSPPLQNKDSLKVVDVHRTEQQVRELFRQFKFEEGTNILNDLSSKYGFSGEARILGALQYDGSLLMNLVPHDDEQEEPMTGEGIANDEGILNVIQGLQDPEDVLLGVLFLDPKTREKAIVYEGSLNPIYQERATIQVVQKTIEPQLFDEIKIQYPETKVLHKISFVLEGFSLDAYVMEDRKGSLRLYSIVDPYKKSPYYTIGQWRKIRKNMESGRPALDGVILSNGSSSDNSPVPPTQETGSVDVLKK